MSADQNLNGALHAVDDHGKAFVWRAHDRCCCAFVDFAVERAVRIDHNLQLYSPILSRKSELASIVANSRANSCSRIPPGSARWRCAAYSANNAASALPESFTGTNDEAHAGNIRIASARHCSFPSGPPVTFIAFFQAAGVTSVIGMSSSATTTRAVA